MRERQHGWMEIYGRRDRIILAESSYGEPQREGTAKMRLSSMLVCVWMYKSPGFKKRVHNNYHKFH